MESNFIKERVVVREELIKKNLKSSEKTKNKPIANTSYENPPDRVVALEEFINEGLRQDLVELSKQVDQTCDIIADYIKVRSALKVFKQSPHDIRVLTNIGCNFYAQCNIEDATRIYLCIGKDYFLRMELDEALKMIDFKEKQLMGRLDTLQEKASAIKAYIKIALEAMGKVYEVDRDKLTSSDT
jgi:prefoldin subunit 5